MTTFDRLFAEAAPLIHQGSHKRDRPPVDARDRWPVTIVLRPDLHSAEKLEQTMVEVEKTAGAGHFRTGMAGSVHFTVRVLEPYREAAGDGDEAVLMDLLTDELGEDAWFEAGFRRDIWYATILHFAADIEQPARLVEWVEERRQLNLGRTVIDSAELVRFRYENGANGRLMRPEVLATAPTRPQG